MENQRTSVALLSKFNRITSPTRKQIPVARLDGCWHNTLSLFGTPGPTAITVAGLDVVVW